MNGKAAEINYSAESETILHQETKARSAVGQLSRELAKDVQDLLNQHLEMMRAEGSSALRSVQGSLFLGFLGLFLAGFGCARLVDALARMIGEQRDWSISSQALVSSGMLFLLAIGLGLFGRKLFGAAQDRLKTIFNEMKEDLQWLTKLL